MDSSKYVKLSIMKSYSMAVSYSGNFSLIFQPCEFIVSEAKTPQIIESIALILSSKNINILIISSDGWSNSWRWDVYIKVEVPCFELTLPSCKIDSLFLLMLYS